MLVFSAVFNLSNNIEVEQTKKMVDQYKKENKDIIQKNRSKLVRKIRPSYRKTVPNW